jgi:pyruvate formate lyase activating enzyme
MMNVVEGRYWHTLDDGRIQCDLCPRFCRLQEEQRGLCFVRKRQNDSIVLTSYGKSSGFAIDPIEKKPLNHFYPGSSVLSFGTAGCNLSCDFCQNWDISKSREMETLSSQASPEALAEACVTNECKSIAFTYNDPVIFLEYAVDTARACHERDVKAVAVTAGYITEAARQEFFSVIDAANIDLKAFSEEFYKKITKSELAPVLDTLRYLKHETEVWFEITTLLIPGLNDSDEMLHRQCDWIVSNLGGEVPLHFSAFHPDFRMKDRPKTPASTLIRARNLAKTHGIKHVYTGNIHDQEGDATACANCGLILIERDWYELHGFHLNAGDCPECGTNLAGHFDSTAGSWGRKRLRVVF